MSSLLRKIERRAARSGKTNGVAAKESESTDHHKLPVGQILSAPVKGDFISMPLFGCMGIRAKVGTPLVLITLALMRKNDHEKRPRGWLRVELPILPETQNATLAALERYGWTGQIWPTDGPLEDPANEVQLKSLLDASNLAATLVFSGTQLQDVAVSRAQGPFLMPPLPEAEGEPDPVKLTRLLELCADPQVFYPKP